MTKIKKIKTIRMYEDKIDALKNVAQKNGITQQAVFDQALDKFLATPEELTSVYFHSDKMQQMYWRDWLERSAQKFKAPYALTLTLSRPKLSIQNTLAKLKRHTYR